MFSAPYSSKPNQRSLAYILKEDVLESRWDGNRLRYKYRNIIRCILQELFKHDNDLGYLDPKCIFLTSGEAKVEQPCNDAPPPRLLRVEFIHLIKDMLGNENNLELNNFITMAERRVTFEKLFHHPLLQSTSERYFFPIRAIVHMNDNVGRSWRRDYRRSRTQAVDFKSAINKAKYKVGLESVYKQNQRTGCKNSVLDVLDFSKNVINHVNEHLEKLREERMTQDEIENQLTGMFPTRLIDLYEFLVSKRISMAFLSRR